MAKRSEIAVFGGTFNPPHNGHIHLLKAFESSINFDKILIVPSAIPPHKKAQSLVSGEHRINMCRLAFPEAGICDYEVKRGGKNYTADTLEHLKKLYPDSNLYFIMGTDTLLSFNSWHEPQRILKNAVLLCDLRDDNITAKELEKFALQKLGLKREQFIISEVKPLELSSTEVRDKIKKGEDISSLVPEGVAEYIRKEGLYAR